MNHVDQCTAYNAVLREELKREGLSEEAIRWQAYYDSVCKEEEQ